MRWRKVKLGELFQIKHGWAFKGEYFSNEGELIVVTPGNFQEQGGFRQVVGKEKFYLGEFPQEYLLGKGDVVIAMTEQGPGLLGSPAIIPADERYLHNQRIGLIKELYSSSVVKKYVYYLFFTKEVRNQIFSSSTGAKVKHTAPRRIYDIDIDLPPVDIQRKITSILSAYDELIENNLKRIKLLEKKAFLMYRGIVRSEKLEKKKLKDVLDLKYGKALKSDDRKDGLFKVYGSSGPVGFHEKFLVEGPGIIVGRKGNVGSVFWSYNNFWPIDTAYYVEPKISLFYLYFNLREQHFENTDAAVPGLNRNFALDNFILVPQEKVIIEIELIAKPVFKLVENLELQNTKLREARDILLPKLMNGQIEV